MDRCGRRYLSAANYDFSYDRAKNLRPKRNIKTAMNNEIMLYGIAQAFGSASLTTQPQPQPPLPSCLTRVLCRVLASLFGFAEGADGF